MQGHQILKDFHPFFDPKSIVIIGASRNEYTFNGIVVKNLLEAQYKGKIHIIHPYTESLMGIKCLNQVNDLVKESVKPELAIILTQKNIIETVVSLAELNIRHILIETDISVNFNNNQRTQLISDLKEIIEKYNLFVLGPSMIGIIDFPHSFTTSIIPTRSHIILPNHKERISSGVSFMAQSGGLTGACGWWAPQQNIPFSKIIHIGKTLKITETDILTYLFEDPSTKIILLYLNDIPESFVEVIKNYKRSKPVLYKYVGKQTSIEENFKDAGAIRVRNYIELFEFAKVFLWSPVPKTNAVGIIGPSSGAINLVISEMRNEGIHLAQLNKENRDFILSKIGGSTCALGNPVDYWPPLEFVGTMVCSIYHNASNSLLKDPHVGALFLALEFFTEIEFNFNIFENIKQRFPDKPIICILIQAEKEGAERIFKIADRLKIPVFDTEIERGVRAFGALLKHYRV
jgi:acyl-CoA synthetase (NDP forming)